MKCFYFGVSPGPNFGHYLHPVSGSRSEAEKSLPFKVHVLDSALLPPNLPQREGVVYRSYINGYTILSFWDRSGDSRPGSNSSFIIEGIIGAVEGLDVARNRFPDVFNRIKFELVPATLMGA